MADGWWRAGKGRRFARIGLGMRLVASLLHCGCGTAEPTPVPRARYADHAQRTPPAPSTDVEREPPKPAESAKAQATQTQEPSIAQMSADERHALARAKLPELDDLLRHTSKPDFARFGGEGATVALWVPESVLSHGVDETKRCRRVVFAVHPDRLAAEVPTNGGEGRPKLKAPATFEELELGENVATYATVTRAVERNARGELVETVQAMGGVAHHGGELLEIRDDAIAYGAVRVGVNAVCGAFEERPCARKDGTGGVCERCTKLGIALSSTRSGVGFGRAKSPRVGINVPELEPVPDCGACPVDALSAEIPRLSEALRDLPFYTVLYHEPWPVISRKREACEAAERAHAKF